MKEKEFLAELLKTQSKSGKEYKVIELITKQLRALKISYEVDYIGNIIATKGTGAVGLVAHTDTVHSINKEPLNFYKDKKGNLHGYRKVIKKKGKPKFIASGIGGDDKVGIYLVMKLSNELPNVRAFFFVQEETGSVGASSLDESYLEPCSYLLQIDRQTIKDIVTEYSGIKLINDDFEAKLKPLLKKYHRKQASGLTTDVISLAMDEKVSVSVANISCGYYNPHTSQEYISIKDVFKTYLFTKDLIKALGEKEYPKVFDKIKYENNYWANIYGYAIDDDYYDDDDDSFYDEVDDDDDEDLKNYAGWYKAYRKDRRKKYGY